MLGLLYLLIALLAVFLATREGDIPLWHPLAIFLLSVLVVVATIFKDALPA
jgi:hypothetical protein